MAGDTDTPISNDAVAAGVSVSISDQSRVGKLVVIGSVEGQVVIQSELLAGDDIEMLRRTFLKQIAVGIGTAVPIPMLQAMDIIRNRANETVLQSTTPDGLDQLELECDAHLDAYAVRAPVQLLQDLVLDFARTRTLIEICRSSRAQRRLLRMLGRLAGIISVILNDLGETSVASDWMRTARITAREAGEHGFEAWTYAREAFYYLHYQRSAKVALSLARAAGESAGNLICSAAVMAPTVEARALARLDDSKHALIALDDADWQFERVGNPDGDNVLGWSLRQLDFSAGKALTTLGEAERAVELQDRALRSFSVEEVLDPTLTGLDRAQALIRGGELVEGCNAAITLLESVPPGYRSSLIDALERAPVILAVAHGDAAPNNISR